jgi:hypothetical protein
MDQLFRLRARLCIALEAAIRGAPTDHQKCVARVLAELAAWEREGTRLQPTLHHGESGGCTRSLG